MEIWNGKDCKSARMNERRNLKKKLRKKEKSIESISLQIVKIKERKQKMQICNCVYRSKWNCIAMAAEEFSVRLILKCIRKVIIIHWYRSRKFCFPSFSSSSLSFAANGMPHGISKWIENNFIIIERPWLWSV